MARKTKVKVIEELRANGIEFDENGNYNDLCKLLKEKTCPIIPEKDENEVLEDLPVIDDRRLTHSKVGGILLSSDIVKRAKNLGFTDEQIATYTDPVALKIACDQVKPQATLYSEPEKKVTHHRRFVGEPAQAICVTEITEVRASHVPRCTYDEGQLGDFCRRERIAPDSIQKLTFTRDCVLTDQKVFITKIVIDYLKKEG